MLKTILFLCLIIGNVLCADEMKMFIIYTPSHEDLFDNWFLPSFKKYNNDIELIIKKIDQTCLTASFQKPGWKDTTLQKVEMIIDAIYKTWNYYFVYSDVDVQFFGPIKKEIELLLQQYDLVVQKDHPDGRICSGFFACRSNEKTLALWKDVYSTMKNIEKYSDQGALNYCLIKKNNPYNLLWTYLPDTYFGGATFTGRPWHSETDFFIPEHPKMHHANWVFGIENKKRQLSNIKMMVDR